MARIKTFDQNQALQSAMMLFWQKGYAETSIQALEQTMKLKRTSIYNAFGNKRQLFQLTLHRYIELVLTRFVVVLEQGKNVEQSIKSILGEVINLHFNPENPGGCMVVLSTLENQQHDKETNAMIDGAVRQLQQALLKRFKRGREQEQFAHALSDLALANQVVALITGMIVMAKAGFGKKELQQLIDSTVSNLFV